MAAAAAAQQAAQRPQGFWFPMGYKEAVSQWWSSVSPAAAERGVLDFVPYIREAADTDAPEPGSAAPPADPHSNPARAWRKTQVPLSGRDRFLNEYSIERPGEDADETLVMMHGYGAGLGFFYKNYEPLSRVRGWRLFALDMLGMGNSARPPFRIGARDPQAKIDEAEAWFVDSLEEWRRARQLDRFTLMGHSLGGYMAAAYALKYPGHVKKLILVSPAGIPEDPYAVNAALPEPTDSTMEAEFTQDQESESAAARPAAAASASAPAVPKRPIPSWAAWLWDANVSPFSIVRFAGPLGPRFTSGWTYRRFSHLPERESRALHDYTFSIFRQRGSGEYVLSYVLAPGAHARRPLINRVQDIGRMALPAAGGGDGEKTAASSSSSLPSRETGIPIVFMYGENDWMDVAGGLVAEEKLKQARIAALRTATEEERRRENGSARVVVVPKAGHHLYLDNPDDFNAAMVIEMEETREYERRGRE